MRFTAQAVPDVAGLVFGAVLRPNKKERRHRWQLREQFPRFRQVIEKSATEDRVEFSKRGQVGGLQVRLDKLDVPNLKKRLDESRLAQIRSAAFQRDDAVYARVFR